MNEKLREWYVKTRDDRLIKAKEYRQRNASAVRESNRRYRERVGKDAVAALYRKSKFGLTSEQYELLLASQGHRCALCGQDEREAGTTGRKRALSIDHCHVTGKVRGILCNRCNIALERADTVENWLEKAAAYLKRSQAL